MKKRFKRFNWRNMLNSFEMNHFVWLRAKVQAPCNNFIDYAIIILAHCVTSPAVSLISKLILHAYAIRCGFIHFNSNIFKLSLFKHRDEERSRNEHPWCSISKMESFVVSRLSAYCNKMLLCLFVAALCNCYSFWPLAVRTQAVTILEQEQERDTHSVYHSHRKP